MESRWKLFVRKYKKAVILFTRVPVPGHTKTRLMPYLSGTQCAALHTCFLRDIAKECEEAKADLWVVHTGTPDDQLPESFRALFPERTQFLPQFGAGLGERMEHAIEHVLNLGYGSCVLIGSDIPEIKEDDFDDAFEVLKTKDIVLGGTADGGYYLIGMKKLHREAFSGQTYGHGSVLEQTAGKLTDAGLTLGYVRTLQDMDTGEDLAGYRNRMRTDRSLWKTHTGKYLARNRKISVIVPIYNEEKTIRRMQNQLKSLQGNCEILFVDGGSTDRTLDMIEPGFRVLHSPKGRANQMNLGAEKSTGDILFFLHCDSDLPMRPLEQIRWVMRDHQAGCFGIAFYSKNFFMFTCRVISNHRVKDRKVMFGDQGIFIDRELFFRAGMYPPIPVMEDYQFSLTLKEMGVKLGMARRRIYTSDRRFPKKTIPKLQLMWKMNRLRKMYRDGVPIEEIDSRYRDVR